MAQSQLTTTQFIEKARQQHGNFYNYDLVEYTSFGNDVKIECPLHGVFEQKPQYHLSGKGCYACGKIKISSRNRKGIDYYLLKFRQKHGTRYKYIIDPDKSYISSDKIQIECPIHKIFTQRISHHCSHGCKACSMDTLRDNKFYTHDEYIEQAKIVNGDKYDYSETKYISSQQKITIICKIHKRSFRTQATAHLQGHGCPTCRYEKASKSLTKTTQRFIKDAQEIHGETYIYDKVEYSSAAEPITIICRIHKEFKQTPQNHLQGHGCQSCRHSVSLLETEWLNQLNVPQSFRNKLVYFKDGTRTNVDAFDPNTNTIYQFYGNYWHGNRRVYLPCHYYKQGKTLMGNLYLNTIEIENKLKADGYNVVSVWEDVSGIKIDYKTLSKNATSRLKLIEHPVQSDEAPWISTELKISLSDIYQLCETERLAVDFLESVIWNNGARCIHCKSPRVILLDTPRKLLYSCKECLKHFTVRKGTIMEKSLIPINKWLLAIYLIYYYKNKVSGKKLSKMIGISYVSAFRLRKRIELTWKLLPKQLKTKDDIKNLFLSRVDMTTSTKENYDERVIRIFDKKVFANTGQAAIEIAGTTHGICVSCRTGGTHRGHQFMRYKKWITSQKT